MLSSAACSNLPLAEYYDELVTDQYISEMSHRAECSSPNTLTFTALNARITSGEACLQLDYQSPSPSGEVSGIQAVLEKVGKVDHCSWRMVSVAIPQCKLNWEPAWPPSISPDFQGLQQQVTMRKLTFRFLQFLSSNMNDETSTRPTPFWGAIALLAPYPRVARCSLACWAWL